MAPRKTAKKPLRRAAKTRKASKAVATKAAARKEAERVLPRLAKEVNVRIEKAEKYAGQAVDHRVAAAVTLTEAKTRCETAGLSFKEWCNSNVTQSYETVRKLAAAGASDDVKGAIEDMRTKTREAMAKHRAKKKAAEQNKATPAPRKVSKFEAATVAMEQLDDKSAVNLIQSEASKHGLAVLTDKKLEQLSERATAKAEPVSSTRKTKTKAGGGLDAALEAFEALSATDKLNFLKTCAEDCGCTLDIPAAVANAIPNFLKRERKSKRRSVAARAA